MDLYAQTNNAILRQIGSKLKELRIERNMKQEEIFRRMVFNVVARNQDDHTKNISFLMDRTGKWRLSPENAARCVLNY